MLSLSGSLLSASKTGDAFHVDTHKYEKGILCANRVYESEFNANMGVKIMYVG